MSLLAYIDDHKKLAGTLAVVHAVFTACAAGVGTGIYIAQHWAEGFNLQQFGIGLGAVGVSVTASIAALVLGGQNGVSQAGDSTRVGS